MRPGMPDPLAAVLDLVYGRWRSQILHAGVELGVFDATNFAPRAAASIALELGLDPALAYRLLRALGSLGLLQEEAHDHRFSLTAAGEILRADHPQSLRGVVLLAEGPEHCAVWKHLPAIVRDGRQDGFVREYGRAAFEHMADAPEYARAFDAGMSSYSGLQTAWVLQALEPCDFASFAHVCDVGGGQGYLLSHLLLRYPHLSGTVLERPGVGADGQASWGRRLGVADRCRHVGGDMFVDVPVADAYFMKMILHDWNDSECVRILRNVRERAAPAGRMFIVEHVVPEAATPHFAKLFDIHMLCWGTGKERTEREYAELLQASGWRYVRTWLPAEGALGVIQGALA
jgi:hypothetical protein